MKKDNSVLEEQSRTIVSVLTDDSNLVNIRTFVVAARFLSFKAAAHFLCLTPGAVSHRIAKLEEALEFPLFNRLTRCISLTKEGERLKHMCLDAFKCFRDEICTQVGQSTFSTLTIYSHQSIALAWLIPRLEEFHTQNPAVQLHIQTGNTLVSFNATSLVDIAIYYSNSAFTGLCSQRFMDEDIFPVCSPAYAAQHDLAGKMHNVASCTLLYDAAAWHFSSPLAEWQEWCQVNSIDIGPQASMISFDTSLATTMAACHSVGIAIGRRKLVQPMLDDNRLIIPFPNLPAVNTGFGYYAVWPRTAYQPPQITTFIDWLTTHGDCNSATA